MVTVKKFKSFVRGWLPRRTNKRRILSGPLRGRWIVTSWHDYPKAIVGLDSKPLLKWLAKNVSPGETWLDVGSHFGYVASALSFMVGKSGRVFAFEPMVNTAGCIQQTRQLNDLPQLTIVPLALANPENLEMKRLSTQKGMIDSTIEQEERAAWAETFFTARLDWLWTHICDNNPHVDGIKVDVQGMEIEVIQGMRDLLTQYKPKLVIELHAGVSREDFLDLIKEVGYSCQATPLEPVEGEVEALFLNDRSYVFSPR